MEKSIEKALVRFLANEADRDDLLQLEQWIQDKDNEAQFRQYIKINAAINTTMNDYNGKQHTKEMLRRRIRQQRRSRSNYLKYAAAVALVFGMGYVYYSTNIKNDRSVMQPSMVNHQIETGTDKATLTLENGKEITLAKGQNYQTDYANSDGEALTYKEKTANDIAHNQLTIPRGGQYRIKLSDGTVVWLNSETQLKYPVAFVPGQDREVELVYGEAYFDVSPSTEHNGAKFKVVQDQQSIEVLGTEFNIKAYQDEQNIYTTLVEGSIALEAPNTTNERTLLIPGQQADLDMNNRTVSLETVKVSNAVAWRQGVFRFRKMPLKEVIKVLSRWYDMEVVFADKELEAVSVTGTYNKKHEVEDLLALMEEVGLINGFNINNKTVTIE